jgi:hypothetical protein
MYTKLLSCCFSCLRKFLCMSCKRSPQKNSPIVEEFGNPIHWCETLMRCRINEPIHWFICSLGYGGVSMNVTLTIYNGIIFCLMQFDVHISDHPQMANPMNAETLINIWNTLHNACPAIVFVHVFVGDITFFTHKRIFNVCFYGTLN